jgi:hypothetical protein
MSRIFDSQIEQIIYRENPWDHRPCPQAHTYEITLTRGHIALITCYQVPSASASGTDTAYALTVDGAPVPLDLKPATRNVPWRLAWAAWQATARA